MIVNVIIDERSSPDHPLGDAIETFIRREDAERFAEEVRGDDPELASYLRIEERRSYERHDEPRQDQRTRNADHQLPGLDSSVSHRPCASRAW